MLKSRLRFGARQLRGSGTHKQPQPHPDIQIAADKIPCGLFDA